MLYARIVETILATAMRRGHYVRDAVVDRRFSHGQRLFDVCGAVVNSGQYVAMQIHHTIRELLASSHNNAPGVFNLTQCNWLHAECRLRLELRLGPWRMP